MYVCIYLKHLRHRIHTYMCVQGISRVALLVTLTMPKRIMNFQALLLNSISPIPRLSNEVTRFRKHPARTYTHLYTHVCIHVHGHILIDVYMCIQSNTVHRTSAYRTRARATLQRYKQSIISFNKFLSWYRIAARTTAE